MMVVKVKIFFVRAVKNWSTLLHRPLVLHTNWEL